MERKHLGDILQSCSDCAYHLQPGREVEKVLAEKSGQSVSIVWSVDFGFTQTIDKNDTSLSSQFAKSSERIESIDVGRAAPFASPIRFESLGLVHDPYTLPAGNPIDP